LKKKYLERISGSLSPHMVFIPLDLAEDLPGGCSVSGRYAGSLPLRRHHSVSPPDTVSGILTFPGTCAPGSRLVFSYFLKSVVKGTSDILGAGRLKTRLPLLSGPILPGWRRLSRSIIPVSRMSGQMNTGEIPEAFRFTGGMVRLSSRVVRSADPGREKRRVQGMENILRPVYAQWTGVSVYFFPDCAESSFCAKL
jgi:hypothetical protein